jgi:hypothetical protein
LFSCLEYSLLTRFYSSIPLCLDLYTLVVLRYIHVSYNKICTKEFTCSYNCVENYMARHINGNGCHKNCERYGRIHVYNGGPRGCTNPSTCLEYSLLTRFYSSIPLCLDLYTLVVLRYIHVSYHNVPKTHHFYFNL